MTSTHVVIVGAGFAGINAAKKLGNKKEIQVTILDKKNYHLFQPLLYQVAMAGLSPAEIASPIRSILSKYNNINVAIGNVTEINLQDQTVKTEFKNYKFDYLILACGATHSYFGKNNWEEFAPGLKSIEQATEIRRRVLTAFELAERENNPKKIREYLTFVIVGGGPTGVELAGSLSEMAHFTLNKEFKNIDLKSTSIILIEAGDRILAGFSPELSEHAKNDLIKIGVTVKTNTRVNEINESGVRIGDDFISSKTVIWAAGVQPSATGKLLSSELDRAGKVVVNEYLHLAEYKNVFVLGDQACAFDKEKRPLPGLAPVAIQQGIHTAKNIIRNCEGKSMMPFSYFDKGQMATIGRGRAISEYSGFKAHGKIAWFAWLFIHILYLVGFRNKVFVFFQWIWSYITFGRGARLITKQEWKNNDG
ncbi:NAD(P)/FAD-dependent oxidoreductase [Fluviispira multicolorata]|uniref:NADH:ubiquinone reductase (non-electrogenic) n=2 Tax=Fluviispira multicolorata TaxID=2654512 RepID=A0A833JI30_9BACT|nr:NAD(P)/FAD-dependent oxidoreductase [Fluviispira multicolorata]